jgi:hypothetical protein
VDLVNRIAIVVVGVAFAASLGFGQASTSAPAAVGHGAVPAKLTKALDSSKLKVGDTVELETTGSFKLPEGTLVPKGSKLTGHVTAASARSKGDTTSQLTVTFDKLNVADGKQLSVKGMVQGVFPPQEEAEPLMAGKASGAAGGGYSPGGIGGGGSAAGTTGTVTDAKSGSDMQSSSKPEPASDPKSTGVQGMRGLELGSDGSILSDGKNVKLGSGVRMIVHVDIF